MLAPSLDLVSVMLAHSLDLASVSPCLPSFAPS